MYYKVDRTFITNGTGKYERGQFITHESASLLGSITSLPGDKATATAEVAERVYVIFIERADEAIRTR